MAVLQQPVLDEAAFKLRLLPFLVTAQASLPSHPSCSSASGSGVQEGMAVPALDHGPVAPLS